MGACLFEHCGRGINADHSPACRLCYRDGNTAVPNGKLDEGSVSPARNFNVEGNIRGHMSGPFDVAVCERLVPTNR